MKKLLFSIVLLVCLTAGLAGQNNRLYVQKVVLACGLDISQIITNVGYTHCQSYAVRATILQNPGEVLSTQSDPPAAIGIGIMGNGSTQPFFAAVRVQLGAFPSGWVAGATLRVAVTYLPTGENTYWEYTLPAGSATIIILDPPQAIPPIEPYPLSISGSFTGPFPEDGITVACTGLPDVVTTNSGTYEFIVAPFDTVTVTPSKDRYVFVPSSRTYQNISSHWSMQDFQIKAHFPQGANSPDPAWGADSVSTHSQHLFWRYWYSSNHVNPTGFKLYFPASSESYVWIPWEGETCYYPLPDTLALNTTYYWRVVPTCEPEGYDAEYTDLWSFTTAPADYTVSGTVTGNYPCDNVTIDYAAYGQTVTDASGAYSFAMNGNQMVHVAPYKERYRFVPSSRYYDSINANQSNQDFQILPDFPLPAIDPVPANGQDSVSVHLTELSWSWQLHPDYPHPYQFKVYFPADAENFTIVDFLGGLTASYPLPDSLIAGTTYTWKVVPALGWGYEAESAEVWTFTTQATTDAADNVLPAIPIKLISSPNPFNLSTTLNYQLPKSGRVSMAIYNLKGQHVRRLESGYRDATNHSVTWDGTDDQGRAVSSGIYYCRLLGSGKAAHCKLLLLR